MKPGRRKNDLTTATTWTRSAAVEHLLAELGLRLLRPARKGEAARLGAQLFKPLRQLMALLHLL